MATTAAATSPAPSHRAARFDRRFGLVLFACFSLLYLSSVKAVFEHGDDRVLYVVTAALAEGDCAVPRSMGGVTQGIDGRFYAKYGLGHSLLALPLYLAGRAVGSAVTAAPVLRCDDGSECASIPILFVTMLCVLATAGTVALLYATCRSLGYGIGGSAAAALALGLGTFAWHYAKYFMSEPTSMFLLLLTFHGMQRAVVSTGVAAGWVALSGMAAGLVLLVKPANAIALVPLALWLVGSVFRDRRPGRETRRRLLAWWAPLAMLTAAAMLYDHWRFGDVWETGYKDEASEFRTPLWLGLAGLLLSPGKSVFVYAPILLAAVRGLRDLGRSQPAAFAVAVTIVGSMLAFYARWYMWWGGGAWGPRFLVPILPFLLIGLAARLDAGVSRFEGAAMIALACASLVVQLAGVAVPYVPYEGRMEATPQLFHLMLWSPRHSPVLAHLRSLVRWEFPLDVAAFSYRAPGIAVLQAGAFAAALLVATVGVRMYRARPLDHVAMTGAPR